MAEVINDTHATEAASAKDKILELEHRYIELLELKIAKLELGLANLESKSSSAKEEKPDQKEAENIAKPKHHGAESNKKKSLSSEDETKKEEKKAADQEEDVEKGEETRYKVVISKWDPETGEYKLVDASKKEEKKDVEGPEKKPKRAFTFRKDTITRLYSGDRLHTEIVSAVVEIEFPELQALLGKITSKWGWPENVTHCHSPFKELVYSWSEAMDEADGIHAPTDETADQRLARKDLKELLSLISTSSGHLKLDQYFKDRKTFLDSETITHNALWTLFPPGTLIVSRPFLDEPQIFSVQDSDSFVDGDEAFELVAYSFDWNGHEFNRVPYQLQIPYWGNDRKSIIELPFYPLMYHTDNDPSISGRHKIPGSSVDDLARRQCLREKSISELKEKLIERGKKYVEICIRPKGKQMFKYAGTAHIHGGRTIFNRGGGSGERQRASEEQSSIGSGDLSIAYDQQYVNKKQISGTTMIDFVSFFEYMSEKTPILGVLTRYLGSVETLSPERRANSIYREMYKFDWDRHQRDEKLSNDQLLLCPPRVLGYALKQKQWAQLLVDKLEDPEKGDAGTFNDKLQLDDSYKDLIRKSVLAHREGKTLTNAGRFRALEDFAPDKGKGLIIMLYGYPGVGKTLTAESVALVAGKPLLSIGVSDIGIEGDKVEANLEKVFDLAGKWEAVLLFDEADVFLEARGEGENDLKRNALVSVLLRVLEYYDGILILTTNRMRSFDIAVQSRIHIAIKYEELEQDQKVNIFMSFITQLQNKKLVQNFEDLENWVKKEGKKFPFNGRQIRNVVSTALGVALMEDGKLRRQHLADVADKTKAFKQDLGSQEAVYKHSHK
ncbi:P-loop containing nucleoside triphosphate hydrolase protein [Delitschia confertaspora ATCC 74209]|uniref:P-loop containing nucleoside triphosphate hydrolase protein n=1 Tax=Delitschia confertaspora ATCC 74209 TaxID=1513339 RepID=A0A9P4JIL6_9PLEO|nr:P-loop containing nucleoside triphosphate hydrolase protein [Delitschia confertaspora ATCC 74209]